MQSIALATNHNLDVASKTPRREHGEVSNQILIPLLGKPREEGMACMHAPCRAGCPSLHPRLRDVAQVRVRALAMPNYPQAHVPYKNVQSMQLANLTQPSSPETHPTNNHSENGSVLEPTFLDSNSNGPQPAPLNHTPSNFHMAAPPTMNSHTPSPPAHAQKMADLEQIWSGLSLEHLHNETVSFIRISVHPRTAMVWNQVL